MRPMSALPPKADIALHRSECPLCAKSGLMHRNIRRPKNRFLKSLVGARAASVAPQGGTPLDSWVLRHPFTKPPPAVSRHALTWVQSRMGGQETTGAGNGHGSRN